MNELKGKIVMVTGAGKGIGLACANAFAEAGAITVLLSRTEKDIDHAVGTIREAGGTAIGYTADVSDFKSINKIVDELNQKYGRVDILVNNAAIIEPQAYLADSDPEQWAQAADINFKGVYFCMRAVLPAMIAQQSGTIINMSSGAANSSLPGWSHYCSTKAAVKKLTETAQKESADHNIRIIGLSPGTVATDMMRKIRDTKINTVGDLDWSVHISPEWVAKAVLFLCGEGGARFAGTDFSLKTPEGRALVGLPAA